ncbi:MAG: type II toxin-antitoxin system VapC family toxin [Clostridia bacterium]|nr:MAG: type II toxin-antitoxin system VapC family toxin [Clostridia bacterium]
MRALLDTHAFLWWITDDPQLSPKAREVISYGGNNLFLSAASGWEIAIKANLGKLQLPADIIPFVSEQLAINSIEPLPVRMDHALHVYTLPDFHRDPFDRLLVAQAQLENMPILTADPQIAQYPVEVIW